MTGTIGIRLDTASPLPLYRQIFDQIAERIRAQAFPPGYQLPPTRDLARELKTHRNTVVHAYEDLEGAGFVSSTIGKGTFVLSIDEPRLARIPKVAARIAPMAWSALASDMSQLEPLRRAERYARAPTERSVINLTRMQPSVDLLPCDALRKCMDYVFRTEGSRALGYAPPEGLHKLRTLIAADLATQGVPASADDVLITTGSQQAIDLIARALVRPGDAILVDSTTYTGAMKLFSMAGARLLPVPSDKEGPVIESLTAIGKSGAKAFYLMPNCHNPTGATVSANRRQALVRTSHDLGIPLIEDDYGAHLNLSDDPPPPALRAMSGDVIYVGTFSKRLAPALRIGFILVPRGLRPTLQALKHAMDLSTSTLLQYCLAEFLERGYLRAHLNQTLPEYRRRRDALELSLRTHAPESLRWTSPKRGVVLWLPTDPSIPPDVLYEEALRRGVLVSPGSLHSVEEHRDLGVRLTFCAEPVERLKEGAKRLGAALQHLTRAPAKRSLRQEQSLETV